MARPQQFYSGETPGFEVAAEKTYYDCPFSGQQKQSGRKVLLNDTTKQIIGNVSNNYPVFSNAELQEMAHEFEWRLPVMINRYNVYTGGQKVFVVFNRLDKPFKIGDQFIENNILLGNGHGGTMSLVIGNTSLYKGIHFNTIIFGSKIRHDSSLEEKVQAVYLDLLEFNEKVIKDIDIINKSMKIDIESADINNLRTLIFDLDNKEVTPQLDTQLSVFDGIMKAKIEEEGKSLWGLYYGAISYNNTLNQNGVNDIPLFGKRQKIDKIATDFLKKFAK